MEFWIDSTLKRLERDSAGKQVEYHRCGCNICDRCWFRPDLEICLYGGPYTGYEPAGEQQTSKGA